MISSKELIERTGISRATLNNYISMGILERPNVLSAVDGEPGVARLGFFPDSAVETILYVKQLKSEGMSMSAIAQKLTTTTDTRSKDEGVAPVSEGKKSPVLDKKGFETESPSNLHVDISVDNIPGPAFMVNNNFELTWWNDEATDTFLSFTTSPIEISQRETFFIYC